jgi:hypothetical protein
MSSKLCTLPYYNAKNACKSNIESLYIYIYVILIYVDFKPKIFQKLKLNITYKLQCTIYIEQNTAVLQNKK